MAKEEASLFHRWMTFIRERFSPFSYIPLVLLFVGMNGSFGTKITGVSWVNPNLYLVWPLCLLFFFRMRLFDEIKDYQTDLRVNPSRPLPRGLLTIGQLKKMIVVSMVLEGLLASSLGRLTLVGYVTGLCFSLLMYNEFFLSDFLSDKLTTYAVSHTFVSVILGMIISVGLVGYHSQLLSASSWGYFLTNWALFNLFEFARKSFAVTEERKGVPTYSNLFGINGAWALSVSQALLANGLLYWAAGEWNTLWLIMSAVYLLFSISYPLMRSAHAASFFRGLTGVFLFLSEVSIIYWLR